MSTTVDTTTKLSYLLPTGTFLTFQVLAPLATNNGKCGLTEKILTSISLGFLVLGCVVTSFTESFTAPDGRVYNGFLTYHGLLVPGYEAAEMVGDDQVGHQVSPKDKKYIEGPMYKPLTTDYINAVLSAVSFLALTMFTEPVSTCFYPNMSDTVLKTVPVLLAAVLSFCCSFSAKIRHGYGNSVPRLPQPRKTSAEV